MNDKIKIILKALSDSTIIRSKRGIVALLLKDTVEGVNTYKGKKYVKESYSAENKKIIEKCFDKYNVKTLKVVCYGEDLATDIKKLANEKFNYLACPSISEETDKKTVADFIKEQREANNILVHAVLNNYSADSEGVINFANSNVKLKSAGQSSAIVGSALVNIAEVGEGTETLTGAEYCVDVACQIATIGFDRSLTGLLVPDVASSDNIEDVDSITEKGSICLYYDYDLDGYVYSDGVNSKTTLKDDEKDSLKKIRVCEVFDMVRDDLKVSFKKSYRGKYGNSYNNRMLIRDSFNLYFKTLQKQGVLNPDENCSCWLDIDKTREYLESKGTDTSDIEDNEVLKKDVDNKLFLKGKIYVLDTVDELYFEINY